ncbi:MAG: quinolinate synthase NadA [Candidatus Eisenbacteria bacterium]|nr:quinolinate synthase NadA [Candidatus Eisenbacteria bacterium]
MTLEELGRLSDDELRARIAELKRSRNAVVLGHNYQVGAVQQMSDHLGDSLKLAQLATETEADVIVLAGVYFMAESAKILNPSKKVLIPSESAGCPMADMATVAELRAFRTEYPGVPVVCYVNTSAAVKAESDICCTSSNAVDVVRSLDSDTVIFVPDKNLGSYVATKVDKTVIPWQGHCYVHNMFVPEDVVLARAEHPDVPLVVHPEAPPQVIAMADHVGSTGDMVRLAREHDELIVGTEIGLIERLNREHPDRRFYPLSAFAVCRNMKMTDLARLAWSLEHEEYVVDVPPETMSGARRALERMLEVTAS